MTAPICLTTYRAQRLNRVPPCEQDERAAWFELNRRRMERIAAAVDASERLATVLEEIERRVG